jgi:hypothetical protein
MKREIALASLLIGAPLASAADPEINVAGFRAVYEISFDSSDASSGVIGAEGRYVFDVDDACEGYATNERFVVRLARAEEPVVQDYRMSAFESATGDSYRFNRSIDLNGRSGQKAKGKLTIDADNSRTVLDYEEAEDQSYEGPILTPIAHLRQLLTTAMAGEGRHAAMIFDGDVDSPTFYAVTRIIEIDDDAETDGDRIEDLEGLARWKIDTVYYPPETGDEGEGATPKFLFEGVLFSNGVVSDMRLDYIDFALRATLSELEVRDSGC